MTSTLVWGGRADADPPHQGGHGQPPLIYNCLRILLVNYDLVWCVHGELCGVMKGKLWLNVWNKVWVMKSLCGGAMMAQPAFRAGSGKAVSAPCHSSRCLESDPECHFLTDNLYSSWPSLNVKMYFDMLSSSSRLYLFSWVGQSEAWPFLILIHKLGHSSAQQQNMCLLTLMHIK